MSLRFREAKVMRIDAFVLVASAVGALAYVPSAPWARFTGAPIKVGYPGPQPTHNAPPDHSCQPTTIQCLKVMSELEQELAEALLPCE
jgi:hypothetical protein